MLSLASEHSADHALAPEAGAHPCVACSDEPSDYMKSQKISCATYVRKVAQARDKCSKHWAYEGLCQRSCYQAGWGSGPCCEEGIARELHQQASASPRRQRAFVVCGQSNALGYGRRSELGPSVKARIAAVADRGGDAVAAAASGAAHVDAGRRAQLAAEVCGRGVRRGDDGALLGRRRRAARKPPPLTEGRRPRARRGVTYQSTVWRMPV